MRLKQLRDDILHISRQLDTAYAKMSPCVRLSYRAAQTLDKLRSALDRQAFLDYCQGEAYEREIGNAQAWYYPAEKALVLWECYLFEPYAKKDPRSDPLLTTVWQGFENALLKELPETTKIYTTYEPIYDRPVYVTFLAKHGYRAVDKVAFVKEVK